VACYNVFSLRRGVLQSFWTGLSRAGVEQVAAGPKAEAADRRSTAPAGRDVATATATATAAGLAKPGLGGGTGLFYCSAASAILVSTKPFSQMLELVSHASLPNDHGIRSALYHRNS